MTRTHLEIQPITRRIPADRQGAKRHYGVHPYFTRRPANVVRSYIQHYTRPGDVVLDPFGGSGVTAIEAMLANRCGVHNDINPLANFIASQIADIEHEDACYVKKAYSQLETSCRARVQQVSQLPDQELSAALSHVRVPENIHLPRSSDAERYYDLFSPRQLISLALLKEGIDRISDRTARDALLLAWSATLGKLNKTFLSAKGRVESRGGSSIFSIYRYKVAEHPVELSAWDTFHERVLNVVEGKEEALKQKHVIEKTQGWQGRFEMHSLDIAELAEALGREADYIFTDPPYGGHIAYLDLSILWNHWLGFDVPSVTREREIIVGGELHFTEDHYIQRLRESVRLCLQMLKRNRWFSIVFQHWNIRYFEAILEETATLGATLKAAVTQTGDTIWSMHKKKNKENVLAGEMILTFLYDGMPRFSRHSVDLKPDVEEIVEEALREVSPEGMPFAGESLFNQIILKAWDRGALHSLDLTRGDFSELLIKRGWRYNIIQHRWFSESKNIPPGFQFTF